MGEYSFWCDPVGLVWVMENGKEIGPFGRCRGDKKLSLLQRIACRVLGIDPKEYAKGTRLMVITDGDRVRFIKDDFLVHESLT